jgi:hypothetical protein
MVEKHICGAVPNRIHAAGTLVVETGGVIVSAVGRDGIVTAAGQSPLHGYQG